MSNSEHNSLWHRCPAFSGHTESSKQNKRDLTWAVPLLESVPIKDMSRSLFVALGSILIIGNGIILRLDLQEKMYLEVNMIREHMGGSVS